MLIFLNCPPISNHLHPLQVENCDSNSRLVVDEDDYGKFRFERVNNRTRALAWQPADLTSTPGLLSSAEHPIAHGMLD